MDKQGQAITHPVLAGLSAATMSQIIGNGNEAATKRQDIWSCKPNYHYLCFKGFGLVKYGINGTKKTVRYLEAGGILHTPKSPNVHILALANLELLEISTAKLFEVSSTDAALATALAKAEYELAQTLITRLVDVTAFEAEQKVASLLLEISKGEYEFNIAATQVELAEMIGISREIFNRAIRKFIKSGWMVKLGRTHKITNRDGLVEFVTQA